MDGWKEKYELILYLTPLETAGETWLIKQVSNMIGYRKSFLESLRSKDGL